MSLSPLRSPPATGSHAEWLEQDLLGAMEPEDRWRVAIATAHRIPRRRLERVDGSPVLEIEVDLAEMDSTMPLLSPSREVDESGAETAAPPPPPNQAAGMNISTSIPVGEATSRR